MLTIKKGICGLKILSQPWWILIPKIKTNQNKQQYFTDKYNGIPFAAQLARAKLMPRVYRSF